jgi:hypothetical protein
MAGLDLNRDGAAVLDQAEPFGAVFVRAGAIA